MEFLFEFLRKHASMWPALSHAGGLHRYSALGNGVFRCYQQLYAAPVGGLNKRYLTCIAKGNVLLVDFLLCSFRYLIVKFGPA